jgi:hypothetical protein
MTLPMMVIETTVTFDGLGYSDKYAFDEVYGFIFHGHDLKIV